MSTKEHGNRKHFYAGFDNGYGSVKLQIDDHSLVRIPSYISQEDMEDVAGRVVVDGKAYTVGESAYRSGATFNANSDHNDNKINNAKITLLGAIAHLPYRRSWELKLVTSLHDASLGDRLKEVLEGEFNPILAGKESTVKVEVLKVVPEGMGVLVGRKLPERLTVLDFGNGTTLYSRYFKGKREVHTPYPNGVQSLIELLTVAMKPLNGGKLGIPAKIRYALENGHTKYSSQIDFKSVYLTTVKDWLSQSLRQPLEQATESKHEGDEVWCIGGGCLLPGVGKLLEKKGFILLENPVDANVNGLLALAKKVG
ncbi:ParM/StbA family protein [Nostoc sp. UHCC 0870]|uniref:ParM/StbA family protein n=1 Tax=Nostoc sp. UHCC 0870 TaxID=2914041 RepID=UPI001EDE8AAD|nr:ParM/StbA family protein [Nostoc sp. UHCC 0870]UKP01610.1 ParM/StbA family protein [Nostoc sp. UHCC 0870]